ncbi:MAG: helix-turn-helix domain-containing protein [Chloroflexi bacterium]|nr:helix-turn-helix domain-containing protein [Chloroflexota bacterium]
MYSSENMENFKQWLQAEMNTREWSISDLARYAGVARGSIANVLRGDRDPGASLCEGIAKAFKMPPEVVFRKAGILPPDVKPDEKRQELVHLFDMMSEENKDDQISYARMRLEKQEREAKGVRRSHASQNL